MKQILLSLFIFCFSFSPVLAQVPGLTWVKNMGGPPDAYVSGSSVATDGSGNIFTTGFFNGTVDFNPGPGTFELTANDQDGFIAKVDANGNFVWAVKFGSDESDEGISVAIDATGNVLVTGIFRGTVDFNPGVGVAELSSLGDADVMVLKLTSAGSFVFAKQIGGVDYDFGKAIQTDASNNIYVTGGYSSEADFNPDESVSFNLTAIDWLDVFITKLDQNGNFVWANSYGNDGEDYDNGETLVIDPSGKIYLAGHYGQGDSGYSSVFIKKLDTNGSLIWEQEFGESNGATVHSIRSDAVGDIYYSGTFDGTVDFNPLGTPVELEGPNSYLCKIGPEGQIIWAKSLAFNSYVENANAMTIDINGNVFLSGFFQSPTFDVDPGPGVANLYTTSSDVGGSFILKLDNAGDYVWAQSFVNPTGTGGFAINAIATDNMANIYIVGGFSETMNFATGVCLPNELTALSTDLLVMKMSPTSVPATCFGVIEQPQSSSIACQGSGVFLTTIAAGAPRVSYQWQKFNGSVFVDISDQEADGESGDEGYEGTNTPYLTVIGIDDSGTGEFRCRVSADFVADVFSDVATLIYTGSSSIPYVVANSGCGPGQFMITASGGTEGNYKWYDPNGVVIDGQVNSTFTTPFISIPTEFSVSKNTAGCESDAVTVEVNTKACAPVPGLEWVAQLKTSSGSVSIKNVAIDVGGNTYSVGTFSGTVDFDSGPGTSLLTTADPNGQEHFFLKLNKDRDVVWVKSLNDTDYSLGMNISFDGSAGIYLSGGFRGTVDFDPGVPVFNLTSAGNLDMFISRFDTDGNFIWAKKIGGSASSAFVSSQSIASDVNGVYATGSFTGTIDFDPGAINQPLTSAGSTFFSDIFICKLDAAGNYAWAFRMGRTSASDGGRGIKVDASGNVYSIGTFSGTVDFDPDPTGVSNLIGLGATDTYIHKVSNAGVFQWAKAITSPGVELPVALALDASGNPHITGTFGTIVNQPSVDFDPGAGVTELFSAQGIIYILKLNTSGDFVWAKNFGATFGAEPSDLTIDAAGNVLLIGNSEGDPDLDPGAGTYSIHSNVNRETFVSSLDASGNFLWAYSIGSTGYSYSNGEGISILTDTEGGIYTAGSVNHSADLDPGHCTFPVFGSYGTGTYIQKIKPGIKALCFNLQPVAANACTGVQATFSVAATGTTNITYQWQKLNTMTSLFENITNTGGYSGTTTPNLVVDTNGNFGAGDYKCLVSGDLVPDKYSEVASLIVSPNNPPSALGNSGCIGSIVLSASGGVDGQYRWYSVASGGTPLGETSNQFTTPELTQTKTYYVALQNACESTRTPVIATILAPPAPIATGASICSSGILTLSATGGNNGQYRWYDIETGGTPLGETSSQFTTPELTQTTSYYVSLLDGCESTRTPVTASILNTRAPITTGSSICSSGTLTLTATGGSNGQYRWYDGETGGTDLGETGGQFTTPEISETTIFYVSLMDACESIRTPVTATILSTPPPPTTTGSSICSSEILTLTATGGSNGQYRWYEAETGGVASDQTNGSYLTSPLTTTTNYYVSINNGTCESERVIAVATVFTPPAKPVVTSSIIPDGDIISICTQSLTLTAPAGFTSYKWSNGSTTQTITITNSPVSNLSVIVTDSNDCHSPPSDPLQVIALASCINEAPSIATATLTTVLEGSVTINLLTLISDADNNLDPGSLRIVNQPTSGALATIDSNGNLLIDYKGISFSGRDRIGIEACDFSGVCTQQELTIDVAGEVVVYNGLSPNGDGKNDFLILQYIEVIEETKNNKVSIFNRWGDVVFEVTNYDNSTRVFSGQNKNGNDLPSGNYFYRIDFESNKQPMTGYLSLKR